MSRGIGARPVLVVALAALTALSAFEASAAKATRKKTATGQSSQLVDAVLQAKTLLAQGNRKLALEQLDKAKELAKTKADQKELAAKKILFAQQFLTSEAFQRYQESKGLAEQSRWEECLRELDSVNERDQDNLLVLKLRGQCEFAAKRYEPAAVTLKRVLAIVPSDSETSFALARVALAQKNAGEALSTLADVEPSTSLESEQQTILRAHALEMLEKPAQAADLLREDQERHLDHIEVIYELGMLYVRMTGRDWQARKLLSLFITRCKRLKDTELKARKFDLLLPEAQATLNAIDKRLGV